VSHLLALTSSTERFTVLLVFLTALLGAIGMVVRIVVKIVKVIAGQLEALEENTRAVRDLSIRMEALEAAPRRGG
jgi:hypothetical protein